ncbi:MAG: alpha/beta hydrolase [Alphaproteobacteria bacterium]|jgi:pimeloyl-ACP methyl ester carboxylesterase|nr:alpha/beta hydrolase [Alphaproteobacteria bacterium]
MKGFNHRSGDYLDIDDAKIYYEVIGNQSAPALLFLHGALGNIADFNGLISGLKEDFKIIGIDNRGHGKSSLGSQELSYELLQKEVEIILKYLSIDSLSILGFSNGGTVAYRLAALSNFKINKLITIGSPWSTKHVEHLMDTYSQLTSCIWKEQCPSDYDSYEKLNPSPDFDRLFKEVIKLALDRSEKGRPNDRVKAISCSLLAARGENDPIVSRSDIVELSELVRKTQRFHIPSAGHEDVLSQPTEFLETLNGFLAH